MTAEELVQQIGTDGDALFRSKFKRADADGNPFPFLPPMLDPGTLLTARAWGAFQDAMTGGEAAGPLFLIPLAVIVDALRLMLKGLYFPFVWLLWRLERALTRGKRRGFFCPLCTNPMEDPLVFCPYCGQIQPRIQPTWSAPLLWRCDCGEGRWRTLGQYLGRCPQPLVCRDLPHFTGCHHPHPLGRLAGQHASTHLALAGTSLRTKHAVMAHLFTHMANGFGKKQLNAVPAWKMSHLELELARMQLCKSFTSHTKESETPGKLYTLSLAFLMLAREERHLYAIHNIARPWLEKTNTLNRKSLDWTLIPNLTIVLDPELLGKIDSSSLPPQAETFSRLIRVIEEFCEIRPGSTLPHRLAIVLPVPRVGFFAELSRDLGGLHPEGATEDRVERVIRERDPALYALVSRCFEPNRVRFFGGPLPDDCDLSETEWLTGVLDWLF